ncbi:SulP family inorganic anion transporter [Pleomorphomonas sp. NRK KF1]|uniref:SulP family inorganic anion transporter n=1 Tax=Pleomorphomonas sp. NRK KF1 TaxID=2943000 RepID=UPI002042D519|nr:SulP family inorganic anion transporter [Pleomorphomonas sp. NRK KF1]MCM5552914.1 SulP family inorganic anion transporter [Pleomorphomonas sp. NRK KF1]
MAIRKYLHSIMFGLIAGIDSLGTSVAFAALIFSGTLVIGFGKGVSVILLSCVLLAVYVAWRSGYRSSLAQVQETNIGILAAAVSAATASMGGATDAEKVSTVFAILAVSTIGTGALCYLSGRFRFGVLIRFLPHSVIAGFLAGSGWLLIDGALMMISNEASVAGIARSALEPAVLAVLIPAIVFATIMSVGLRLTVSPAVAPAITLLAIGLFYGLLLSGGLSAESARHLHWLPDVPPDQAGLTLPSPLSIALQADWQAVVGILPIIAAIPLITIAGLLLNTSGLEAASGRDINANAELKVAGQANLAVGILGGAPGFTGLGMTLLAGRLGVKDRSAGLATALALALALPFATELASAIPLFVAAGLMLMLGGELFYDWAIASRRTLPALEWAVALAIVVSMMIFGFVTGIALGLIFAVVTFVYNYARLPVVRLEASSRERRSRTDRSSTANHILDENGHLIQIIELQGYLFFGTVEQIVRAVRRRIGKDAPPRCLILDFRGVSGMDSAAMAGFSKIFNMLASERVSVVLSPATHDVRQIAERAEGARGRPLPVSVEMDLDHALEAAENELLAAHGDTGQSRSIAAHLVRELGPHPRLPALISAMRRIEMKADETLISAGDEASDVFVLASGRVKVQVTLESGRKLRLRSMTAGAVLGEVAFYLGGKRTADVIVEEDAVLFCLTGEMLRRLEADDAELAVLAHRLFAATLAERLALANRLVQLAYA